MASVHKRKKGTRTVYDVRWRQLDGTNRSKTLGTKAAAEALAAEVEDAVSAGRDWHPAEVRRVPALLTVAEAYLLDQSRTLTPRTLRRYAGGLDLFVRHLSADGVTAPTIAELNKARLRSFWTWLELPETARHGHPRSPGSARKVVEVVQLLWAWAYEEDDYHEDTLPPRKLTMPRRAVGVVVAPSWADMDALLLQLDPNRWQYRAAVLARCTGLRRSELMALTWSDVLSSPPRIAVRSETTKGSNTGRVVPMAPVLVAELARWPKDGPELVGAPAAEYTGRGHLDRDLRRAWVRAGVPRQVWSGRPTHTLRKGFATGLRVLGADADAVKYLTGHKLGGAGAHGNYLDAQQLPITAAVRLVPALPDKKVSADSRETNPNPNDQPELPRAR